MLQKGLGLFFLFFLQEQRVTDLLWSDPTDNDSVLGVVRNDVRDPDGSGRICKFGPDRVHRFLAENDLQLIIRYVSFSSSRPPPFSGSALSSSSHAVLSFFFLSPFLRVTPRRGTCLLCVLLNSRYICTESHRRMDIQTDRETAMHVCINVERVDTCVYAYLCGV